MNVDTFLEGQSVITQIPFNVSQWCTLSTTTTTTKYPNVCDNYGEQSTVVKFKKERRVILRHCCGTSRISDRHSA